MARHFVAASSQYLENTNAPAVTATPMTIALWFKPADDVIARLLGLEDRTNARSTFIVQYEGSAASNGPLAGQQGWNGSSVVSGLAFRSTAPFIAATIGGWNHVVGVFRSNSSRDVYLNGALVASDTTTVPAPSGINGISLGRFYNAGAPAAYFSGDLTQIGIWDVALSDAEIAQLAAWTLPSAIQGAHLIHYWALAGTASPEPDTGTGTTRNLTVSGATGIADPTTAPTAPTPPATTGILINGTNVSATKRVRLMSIGIRDVLNEQPNTCDFRAGLQPASVGDVHVWYISGATTAHLFGGTLIQPRQSYLLQPRNQDWPATAIDYTYLLNRRRPLARYENVSASFIVRDLVTRFTSGFYSSQVQVNLPTITAITFDGTKEFSECLTQLATRIGGYWYPDYDRDLHFFITETTSAPDALDGSTNPLVDPPLTYTIDYSQVRNRVYVRGAGTNVLSDTLANETIIPIEAAELFSVTGGQASARGYQIIAYTGRRLRTGGTIVGSGASPSAAPGLAAAAGSGVEDGTHLYAVTFVTGAGESLPSPTASITVSGVAAPANAPVAVQNSNGSIGTTAWAPGDSVEWAVTYVTALGETTASSLSNTLTGVQNPNFGAGVCYTADLSGIPVPTDGRVTSKKLYRRKNGSYGSPSGFHKSLTPSVTNAIGFDTSTTGDGNAPPGSNTAGGNHVSISGIPIGASGVTSRKIYRTVAGGAQLKLLTTIADNTTTTYTDSTADASLGANVPTSDTSGLTQPTGQVNAGSTSLVVAGTGSFFSGGGWAEVGSQVIRYTGITGNTLTGIPASGPGAIATTISYNSVVTPAPSLVGITGLTIPLYLNAGAAEGSAIAIWVQRDDTVAQAALATLEGGGSDGIHEYTIIDDSLTNIADCAARGDAELALFASPIITIRYSTFDVKTRSGKTVHVALPAPTSLAGDFKIQDVSIDWIDVHGAPRPRFSVIASSVKFSLEDLLRRVVLAAA